jgi:hypothetical protein
MFSGVGRLLVFSMWSSFPSHKGSKAERHVHVGADLDVWRERAEQRLSPGRREHGGIAISRVVAASMENEK